MSLSSGEILGAEIRSIERKDSVLGRLLRRIVDKTVAIKEEAEKATTESDATTVYPPSSKVLAGMAVVLHDNIVEPADPANEAHRGYPSGVSVSTGNGSVEVQFTGEVDVMLDSATTAVAGGDLLFASATEPGKVCRGWVSGEAGQMLIGFATASSSGSWARAFINPLARHYYSRGS